MNDVLSKIKDILDERQWSLYKLAKEAGIPYSSLTSLYQNNNQPTLATLEKLCQGLHITVGEFFSDETPFREFEEAYTEDEKELIRQYRSLTRNNKKLLCDILKVLQRHE